MRAILKGNNLEIELEKREIPTEVAKDTRRLGGKEGALGNLFSEKGEVVGTVLLVLHTGRSIERVLPPDKKETEVKVPIGYLPRLMAGEEIKEGSPYTSIRCNGTKE